MSAGEFACGLWKLGGAIIFDVEGFDEPAKFESKSYEWDLANLKIELKRRDAPTSGPVFEKLQHELQAVWGEGEAPEAAPRVVPRGPERGGRTHLSSPMDGQTLFDLNLAILG